MRQSILLALVLMVVGSAGAHETKPVVHAPPGGALTAQPNLSVIKQAADFALPDLDGKMVRLADYRGRVLLLAFIYTTCATTCPRLTYQMSLLQARLKATGRPPRRAGLVSVTVDPEHDTPPVLARYAEKFSADRTSWRFLTDTPTRVKAVLAAYGEWTKPLSNGELDHPARVYLIDPQGRVREIYSLAFFDERQAFLDIQVLLREPG